MLRLLVDGICDLVYPPHCFVCKNHLTTPFPTEKLCASCLTDVARNVPPFCLKCSRSMGPDPQRPLCFSCTKRPPIYDFAWSACLYQEPLRHMLHQFKYNQRTSLRHCLAGLMVTFIETYALDIRQFDLILPIPLYHSRLRERGYNQARLLAQRLSAHYSIPLRAGVLVKARPTQHQTLLNEKERWTNIHGAFRIKNSHDIQGKSVLIIDDLLTTGATASEAARVLKAHGAMRVGVFTLAITINYGT